MARLIDADALMKNVGKIPQLRGITYGRMKKAVEETPTIDAEPVRHGRWVKGENWGVTCSECSCLAIAHDGKNYCPNCGAKMDGGAEE